MHRAQLSDEAASYIRDMIMSGQLPSGTFIRLDHMADMLEMSVTPVREALVLLRGEGFVQLEPRRGFVVAPLSKADVVDLFWVQSEIAGELAARAAAHITDAEVGELRTLQTQLEAASERDGAADIEQLNFLIHRRINLLAHSPKLAWLLRVATRYAPRRFWGTIHGWVEASVADHAAILDGLEARDPEHVRKAMREHIMHAGTLLVAHLEKEVLAEAWAADDDEPAAGVRHQFQPPVRGER
ncbi:MAG: GntR family transcriptional regulator [Streptosporangiaceae bacterium]